MNTKAVAFGLVIALVLTVGTVSALSNSGGGDWEYYKEIWIKENSGTNLSDYQVLVELEPSNFPDKAKSDGSDLRFTEDGEELSYWVEEYNDSARTARIWVEVPNITANGEAKVKMYYGNPSAGAVSDGNATFVFFDAFEQDAVGSNPSKWTVTERSSTYVEIVNSPTYEGSRAVKLHTAGHSPNSIISHNLSAGLTKGVWQLVTRFERVPAESAYINVAGGPIMIHYNGANGFGLYARYSGEWHFISSAITGTWYRIKVIFDTDSDTYDIYVDGTLKASAVPFCAATGPISEVRFSQWSGTTQTNYIDLNIVRKYTSPEPTVTFAHDFSAWQYNRTISIKENSGTDLTDYQVLINLSGNNFPVEANESCADIRFVDEYGNVLNYWIEEYNYAAKNAMIWVKVYGMPANENVTLQMYLGNPDASAMSNGNATFEFFDDFYGTTLNSDKWHEDAVNNIDYTINNYFRFEDATKGGGYPHPYWIYDGTDTGSQHQAKWTPLNSFIVEWNSKISNIAASENGEGGVAIITTDNTIIYYAGHTDPWSGGIDTRRTVTDEKSDSYALNVNSGDEAKFSIAKDGDNYTAIINDIVVDNYTSSAQVSKIALTAGAAGNPFVDYVQVNDLRVRKYTSPEPTIALFQEYPSDYGLVAEWYFDEGSGNVTEDSSGNENDGTIYGATWTTGVAGKALSFDGVEDYVNVGYPGGFFSTYTDCTDVTVEAWIKPNIVNQKQVIYQVGGYNNALAIGILDDGTVRFALQKGGTWKHIKSTDTLTPISWYHVVGVNGEGSYKLYINGELITSYTNQFTWNTGEDGHTIGGVYKRQSNLDDDCSATQMFNGTIDEVRIYNRALTATEIKTNYEKIKPAEEIATKQKIVFASDRSGNSDIWMMDPDGTNLEQLTTNTSADTSPQISPDGTKIAFLSDRTGTWQVWLMNTDGSNHNQLFDVNELSIPYDEYEKRVNNPTWAPDGSYLITHIELVGEVHSAPWAAIYRHDPDGTNPQLFLDWGPSINGKFSISSDGRKFAYCREDSSYWTPTLKISVGNIVEGVVDETSINNLNATIDGLVDEDVVWFSNGNNLMWSKSNNSEGYGIPQNLYSMNIDETHIKKLTTFTDKYARLPDFAPDEQKVVFTVSNETTAGIYTMNANESGVEALLVDGYKNSGPCWGDVAVTALVLFDTGEGTYPSIKGTHNGTIKPLHNFTVRRLYTYPCAGTGGHTESIEII